MLAKNIEIDCTWPPISVSLTAAGHVGFTHRASLCCHVGLDLVCLYEDEEGEKFPLTQREDVKFKTIYLWLDITKSVSSIGW